MLSEFLAPFAASGVCQAESVTCSSECDNTAAIIGGVVAVAIVFIVTAALATVVIVVLILRSCRAHYSTPRTRTRYYECSNSYLYLV